jgi:Methylamine utilisation protein MauE
MDPVVDATLRAGLALLFLMAAVHKLRDLAGFRATFAEYRLVPGVLVPLGVTTVIGAELALAVGLALPAGPAVFALAAAMLAFYAAAIGVNLARGRRHIDCGCAGPGARRPISGWLITRNLVLAAAALAGIVPVRPRPLVWIDALTVVGATVVLAALWISLDRLLADAPALARLRGDA